MENIQIGNWAGKDGLKVEISISGSFDKYRRVEFNEAVDLIPENVNRLVVDLEKVTFIDNAAIGMLLGLRMFATMHKIELIIMNCHSPVRPLLKRACVDSLFNYGQTTDIDS